MFRWWSTCVSNIAPDDRSWSRLNWVWEQREEEKTEQWTRFLKETKPKRAREEEKIKFSVFNFSTFSAFYFILCCVEYFLYFFHIFYFTIRRLFSQSRDSVATRHNFSLADPLCELGVTFDLTSSFSRFLQVLRWKFKRTPENCDQEENCKKSWISWVSWKGKLKSSVFPNLWIEFCGYFGPPCSEIREMAK